jgi:hypothetical protein
MLIQTKILNNCIILYTLCFMYNSSYVDLLNEIHFFNLLFVASIEVSASLPYGTASSVSLLSNWQNSVR